MQVRRPRQIFAYSGVLGDEQARRRNFDLTQHAISLASGLRRSPKVCYVPTAVGDSAEAIASKTVLFAERRPDVEFSTLTLFTQPNVPSPKAHLLSQDVILVEGGSVVNLLAVWRAHQLPEILRQCWDAGIVLAGASAGSLCWHQGGPTDSWGDHLAPFTDGLGFLPFSNNVHDDLTDQPRHRRYRELVAAGTLPPGYATPGGVGLHYVDTALREAVTVRSDVRASYVTRDASTPEAIDTRLLEH